MARMNLQIDIVRKTYPATNVAALENLRFSVEAGEFLAIVGPSGAGKSTLLNIISGLDRDLEGKTMLGGQTLHTNGVSHAQIGFIFQESRLMPWLSALDNLRLVLGQDDAGTQRARSLLQDVGLADREDAFPGQLSGGMQRRIALARAFAQRPSLLLMDEPFVSLDAPTAERLRELLLTLWTETKPTVLFVTHNLREALALADRVLFLSGSPGRVVLEQPITLARPRHPEDDDVSALHNQLLNEHPDLLSGLATSENETHE